ncbi:MAG: glycosyltransferase, partial [Propionibacteriaceae bacterium]|nr:glycosyltransferase [Propionibacteriaceae bacterium]
MSRPQVSVVVPAFNAEAYLERALMSLVGQTLRDLEVVVVDDGSTDRTPAIAAAMADAYPGRVVVVTKPNGGLSDARNAGVAHSTGEYVGFVDADDFVEPQMYEHLYQLASINQCEIAICRYVHEDPSGDNGTIGGVFPFGEGEVFGPAGFFLNTHVLMVCNKIYRRELVESHPQPATWFEDVAWSPVVISKVTRICSTPKVYYHYLRRPGSIASSHRDERTLQGLASLRYALDHADPRYWDEVRYLAAQRLRFEAKRRRLYADRYMSVLHSLRNEIGDSRSVLNDTRLYLAIARYLREGFHTIPQAVVSAVLGRDRTAQQQQNSRTWADPLC